MNTKNLFLTALLSTLCMVTMQGSEVAPMDMSSDKTEKSIQRYFPALLVQQTINVDNTHRSNYGSLTPLHELLLYKGLCNAFDISRRAYVSRYDAWSVNELLKSPDAIFYFVKYVVQHGCSLDRKTIWQSQMRFGGGMFYTTPSVPPLSRNLRKPLTFADLVQMIIMLDNNPDDKKNFISNYPDAITDKQMLVAICKGTRSAITSREAGTEVYKYLFAGPTSMVMEYVGRVTNSPEEDNEITKLDKIITQHQ